MYGAELEENRFMANVTGPVALVIGSEGKGLSRLVKEHCDEVLTIDMYGHEFLKRIGKRRHYDI